MKKSQQNKWVYRTLDLFVASIDFITNHEVLNQSKTMSLKGSFKNEPSVSLVKVSIYCRHSSRHTYAQHISAICVQEFDDSRNSAIHMTYRSSLRSSSTWEPRYPLLQVVLVLFYLYSKHQSNQITKVIWLILISLFEIHSNNNVSKQYCWGLQQVY